MEVYVLPTPSLPLLAQLTACRLVCRSLSRTSAHNKNVVGRLAAASFACSRLIAAAPKWACGGKIVLEVDVVDESAQHWPGHYVCLALRLSAGPPRWSNRGNSGLDDLVDDGLVLEVAAVVESVWHWLGRSVCPALRLSAGTPKWSHGGNSGLDDLVDVASPQRQVLDGRAAVLQLASLWSVWYGAPAQRKVASRPTGVCSLRLCPQGSMVRWSLSLAPPQRMVA